MEKKGVNEIINFAKLLELVAVVHPDLRVRFSTSHPKDITDEVLHTMAKYENICKNIHLPVQSGSSRILELMNRGYSREWYLDRVKSIRRILGEDCGITSDMIAGFCTETDEDHLETISIMDEVRYDYSFMFIYSERPGTLAAKKYADDIPVDVKKLRLEAIIKKQSELSLLRNQRDVNKIHQVLVEGTSKRSEEFLQGRNSANKVVIFLKENKKKGDYVNVLVERCSQGTLFGVLVN